MENTLIFQYILVGLIVAFAVFSLYNVIRKTFSPKKFKSKRTGCDSDCGCS